MNSKRLFEAQECWAHIPAEIALGEIKPAASIRQGLCGPICYSHQRLGVLWCPQHLA